MVSRLLPSSWGCHAARHFAEVLLIDDACALPSNFPVVSDKFTDDVKCIGYSIKSVGKDFSKGAVCQQAQDLEYKLGGLQRGLAGKIGAATFAHGAISLWKTDFLIRTFHKHHGFNISEDWFLGHFARQLGSRAVMCTSVFIETETPSALFFGLSWSTGWPPRPPIDILSTLTSCCLPIPSGGVEPIIRVTQRALDGTLGNLFTHLTSLEFSIAFNTLDGQDMAAGLGGFAPSLYRAGKWAYVTATDLIIGSRRPIAISHPVFRSKGPTG